MTPRPLSIAPVSLAVMACALMLGCPIWTEDADFVGTGVATWTSDRVAHYLKPAT